jgi:hypothetical protein
MKKKRPNNKVIQLNQRNKIDFQQDLSNNSFSIGSNNNFLLRNIDIPVQDSVFNPHDLYTSDDDFDNDESESKESIYKEIFSRFYKDIIRYLSDINRRWFEFSKLKFFLLFSSFVFLVYTLFIRKDYSNYDIAYNKSFIKLNTNSSILNKLIIPDLDEMFPDQDIKISSDLFDPRLSSALLLLYLQHQIIENNGELKQNFSIPFSWEDWIDIETKLKYDTDYLVDWLSIHSNGFLNNLEEFKSLDCKTFALLYGCEDNQNFLSQCSNLDDSKKTFNYPYKFEIKGPTDAKIRESGRYLYTASYLKFNMPPPERLYLLNVFGSKSEGSLMIKIDSTKNLKRNKILRNKDVIKEFINWEILQSNKNIEKFIEDGWNIEKIKRKFSNLLGNTIIEKIIPRSKHYLINQDETYLAIKDNNKIDKMKTTNWEFNDFLWDEQEFLYSMSFAIEEDDELDENHYDYKLYKKLENLENFKINNGYHPKYLYEAELYGTDIGTHFDWRFFSGSLILNDYRQSIIHRLSRTWLRFCLKNGLKTFIAYGSLLGWIRNGLTLPWDGDIDVIVTMETLNLLARNFNQTLIIDYSDEDEFQSAMTGYFLDINPAYYNRIKGDGNNVIDGRLIDINTGVYLDITALTWTEDYLKQIGMNNELKKLIDKDYEMNQYFAVEGEIYGNTLMEELKKLQNEKQLIHCKNNNVYTVNELSIMIPSYFEGVRAYFPHSYENIIWRLYPKALTRITEQDYIFDNEFNLWLNIHDCPELGDYFGNLLPNAPFGTCLNPNVLQEYNLTKKYTSRHLSMLERNDWDHYELDEDTESKPFRIDEFFVLYGEALGLNKEELEQLYM